MTFLEKIQNQILILDGGIGSQLFKKLPEYHGCLELLNDIEPGTVKQVHHEYILAGADVIETNTFGGSAIKLNQYGLAERCYELNKKAAEIVKSVITDGQFAAGSVGPSGVLMEPMGEYTYNEVYESFKQQILGLRDGGADVIIIETMSDLQEAKTAINAAKQNTKLPVICNMTFDLNGKTLSGTGLFTALAALNHHGADIVGTNCGLGPEEILKILTANIEELLLLECPVAVWANAGLPQIIEGKTSYSQSPEEFAATNFKIAELGINLIGGCCGTTPDHIRSLKKILMEFNYKKRKFNRTYNYAVSNLKHVSMNSQNFIKIGERLNPTARKAFGAELSEGSSLFLRRESITQQQEGADILDINVGVPGIDEIKAMQKSIMTLSTLVSTPLMIDSDNPQVIEEALKLYAGIPIVNSINGKSSSFEKIIPILKKYGCFILALCLDESGIHVSAEKRISIGNDIIHKLNASGIINSRIIIDPLMLTESAEPGAAGETLKVIKYFKSKNIKTSIGLSNISFGLPERKHLNNVFLKLAVENGLSMAIINTNTVKFINELNEFEKAALEFLEGKDPMASKYIQLCNASAGSTVTAPDADKEKITASPIDEIREMIISGNTDSIEDAVKKHISDFSAEDIMNNALLKGLETVGEYYSSGKYFLPQMIASANAMKKGFNLLKTHLTSKSASSKGTIVICTVEGDVHDIGKNIVAMMFENHGFQVFDLGKDVKNIDILTKAKEVNADIICLSSLLTTTMPKMKDLAELLKTGNFSFKLMIGGAVVTQNYADSIGAFYSKDAVEAVATAKKILKN